MRNYYWGDDMGIVTNDEFLFILTIVLVVAIVIAIIRILITYIMKIEFRMKIVLFLYFLAMYVLLFIIGFVAIGKVSFVQQAINNWLSFMIFLGILSLLEIAISYFVIFKKSNQKRYLEYVFYSYGSMLLILWVLLNRVLGNTLFHMG